MSRRRASRRGYKLANGLASSGRSMRQPICVLEGSTGDADFFMKKGRPREDRPFLYRTRMTGITPHPPHADAAAVPVPSA